MRFIHVLPDKTSNIWLDFVGSYYYSVQKFLKEAQALGFSRLVDRYGRVGDLVLFAQKRDNKSKVFAIGIVEGFCLPNDLLEEIKKERPDLVEVTYEKPATPEFRGCGHLFLIGRYNISEGKEDEFTEMINRKVQERRKNKESLPKIFMRGQVIKVFKHTVRLIGDYSRMPYKVRIVKTSEDLQPLIKATERIQNIIHSAQLYKLKKEGA